MGNGAIRMAGLVVAAGLVLSGCTGSPDADADPSPPAEPTSASPSASPSSSGPAKPERPDAMKRKDAKGAAAAAEYFLSLYSYTKVTGDTEEWDAMSHRACAFCRTAMEHANEISSNGDTYTGGELSMEVTQTYMKDDLTGIYPLDIDLTQAPFQVFNTDGELIESSEGESLDRRVEVGRKDSAWIVVTVAPVPDGER